MTTSDMCQTGSGAPKTPAKIFFSCSISVLLTDDWYTTYDPPDVIIDNNLTGEDEHLVKDVAVHRNNVLGDIISCYTT